jgi:hypothetical protein
VFLFLFERTEKFNENAEMSLSFSASEPHISSLHSLTLDRIARKLSGVRAFGFAFLKLANALLFARSDFPKLRS